MAARGQGFKSPQPYRHNTAGRRLALRFSAASCCCRIARFVPPACHSVLAAASQSGSMRRGSAHPGRPRWRRPGRPSRAGSAAPQPRRSAPSGPSVPGCSPRPRWTGWLRCAAGHGSEAPASGPALFDDCRAAPFLRRKWTFGAVRSTDITGQHVLARPVPVATCLVSQVGGRTAAIG
jgi:hypothetical protein